MNRCMFQLNPSAGKNSRLKCIKRMLDEGRIIERAEKMYVKETEMNPNDQVEMSMKNIYDMRGIEQTWRNGKGKYKTIPPIQTMRNVNGEEAVNII